MDALVARYREPHRRYHGVAHLAAVLRTLDELLAPEPASPAVRFAAWFHDAVYDPTAPAGANEAASAWSWPGRCSACSARRLPWWPMCGR